MTVIPFHVLRHRGRAASLALAIALGAVSIAAAPHALLAQASESVQSSVRLTQPSLRRFASVTKQLAALMRRDPAAGHALSGGATPPAASRIFADGGMTRDEYLQFFVALIDAASAAYVIESDPSAASEMSGLIEANVSFVQKHKAAIDALGPDIKTIQKAGEDD